MKLLQSAVFILTTALFLGYAQAEGKPEAGAAKGAPAIQAADLGTAESSKWSSSEGSRIQGSRVFWKRNYGYLARLYPSGGGHFYFSLRGGETAAQPKDGYYYVASENKNYRDIVDLLYLAAGNGWQVHVRPEEQRNRSGHVEARYVMLTLPQTPEKRDAVSDSQKKKQSLEPSAPPPHPKNP